jgi:hypothetical protein
LVQKVHKGLEALRALMAKTVKKGISPNTCGEAKTCAFRTITELGVNGSSYRVPPVHKVQKGQQQAPWKQSRQQDSRQ